MRKLVSSLGVAVAVGLLTFGGEGTVHGQNPPPPPPPPPGGFATPTPTATSVPPTLAVQIAHGNVAPRAKQSLTISTAAGVSLSVVVVFPNGDKKTHTGTANATGRLTWSYVQPGSRITHTSRTARVTVTASNGPQSVSAVRSYTIGFADLDVSAEPRAVKRGGTVTIWAHTKPSTVVSITLAGLYTLRKTTGGNGWTATQLSLSTGAPSGRIAVKGRANVNGRAISGETSFRVR